MENLKDILVDLDPDEEQDVVLEYLGKLQKQIENVRAKEGAPGKDGKDGRNGRDGIDGLDGRNGKDGRDGRDGEKGEKGERGDKGDAGKDGTSVSLKDVLDDLKLELSKRWRGGGNMNRNIGINGNSSVLSRYTDINLKQGSNVTLTYANNDVTKQTDVTITATGGAGNTFVYNEVLGGSGQAFTFATAPIAGLYTIYGRGQKLIPTTDYTVSGSNVTTVDTWAANDLLGDSQHV